MRRRKRAADISRPTRAVRQLRLLPGGLMGFARRRGFICVARTKAQWNVVAQDVLMAQYREKDNGVDSFWTDDWDGYPANRARLLKQISDTRVSNPVVVGGDIHSFFANDLRLDLNDQGSPVVATGVCGHLDCIRWPPYELIAQTLPDNPHVYFFEKPPPRLRLRRSFDRKQMARMQVVSDAHDPGRRACDVEDVRGRKRPRRRGRGVVDPNQSRLFRRVPTAAIQGWCGYRPLSIREGGSYTGDDRRLSSYFWRCCQCRCARPNAFFGEFLKPTRTAPAFRCPRKRRVYLHAGRRHADRAAARRRTRAQLRPPRPHLCAADHGAEIGEEDRQCGRPGCCGASNVFA